MICILIPTYNEASTIVELIKKTHTALTNHEHIIIVVDDNSPDGTGALVESLRDAEYLQILHRPQKTGLGSALTQGMVHALKYQPDYILSLDADFSHNPTYIPRLLARAESNTIVIGSRYTKDGSSDLSAWRHFLSKMGNLAIRKLIGMPAADCTGGFRVYSAFSLIKGLEVKLPSGYDFQFALLARLVKQGVTIIEEPIHFTVRQLGKSKLRYKDICNSLRTLFLLWLK